MSDAAADPVQRLLALEELRTLKARFFRLVDAQDWEELRGCFCDDARFAFPGLGVFDDPDAAVAGIRAGLTGTTTIHHGHLPELELLGPDHARGVWPMSDLVVRDPTSAGRVPGYPEAFRAGHRGHGRYHEEYRREGGVWRIATLRLERLHLEPLREV